MNKPSRWRYLATILSEPPLRLGVRAALKVAHRLAPNNPAIFQWAANFDALCYTPYAVGLLVAAKYALRAQQSGFTAVEFGVAGGNGLLALSRYAALTSKLTGLEIKVVGFDAAGGLPDTEDIRDAPWHWNSGDFPCHVNLLRSKLPAGTELILGRIEETFPRWLQGPVDFPVGFMSVDVDFYSSARAICQALGKAPACSISPMIQCYFDDYLQPFVPRKVGEAAALHEFNLSNEQRFFDRDDWLSEGRAYAERLWLRRMHTFYSLDHPAMQSRKSRAPERLDLIAS